MKRVEKEGQSGDMVFDHNRALVLYGPNDMRVEKVPQPLISDNDVLIKMKAVGICGSDIHYWTYGEIEGVAKLKKPMIMGHESSGVVVKVGDKVNNIRVGDRVAIEPGIPCRLCMSCKIGKYNLCDSMAFCATPPIDGSLCSFYAHPADFVYKLPDHVSFDEGAMLEPLAVGVHACNRAKVTLGTRVLICGAGPIGLVSVLVAKAAGASTIIVTDLDKSRLDVAKSIGADHVVQVDTRDGEVMAAKIIDTCTSVQHAYVHHEVIGRSAVDRAQHDGTCTPDNFSIDCTIECSGAESSIHTAIHATGKGGTIVLVGMGKNIVSLPIVTAAAREIDIRGIFRYVNCYPTALRLVASGKVNVKPLITHRFKAKDFLEAFETSKAMKDGCIKVMIDPEYFSDVDVVD
eukprot:Nk52_evm1s805 gene=Nk52_evmTU1s805